MSGYAGLTNESLRRRLESFNFPVPPITSTTRGVLVKKLEKLEREGKGRKGQQQRGESWLLIRF